MNKREGSGSSCKFALYLHSNKEVDTFTINVLKLFKEKKLDSKILSHYDNINNIFNTEYLHDNAETIGDL